jgi:transcriptional regulator with XRE-family HTH domain
MAEDLNSRIRKFRELKGYSQENIAMDLGLNQSQYSRRESGQIEFSAKELKMLSKILERNLDDLLNTKPMPASSNRVFEQQSASDLCSIVLNLIDVLVSHDKSGELTKRFLKEFEVKFKKNQTPNPSV